jgi:uncharacterized lipoprotein YajG
LIFGGENVFNSPSVDTDETGWGALSMRAIFCLAICWALSACALTKDYIDVPYQAGANLSVVEGAASAKVAVTGVDGRTVYRDRVSVKKNGYGMEMAEIIAKNDVPDTVGRAIEQELASLGFAIGPGGSDVNVEVTRFYNDFKTGFFSGDAVAEVNVNVKVTGPDKVILFSKHYEGGGIEKNIMMMGGDNARAALIMALRNAVALVINDTELQNALLSSARKSPVAAAAPPTS